MKYKSILPILAVAVLGLIAFKPFSVASYTADTNASTLNWTGYKVTGQHTGTIKVKQGNWTMTDGKLTGGSFEIDMNSLKCTDLEGDMAGKLEGHLKSEDFFGTAMYPVSKFVITKAIPQDSKGNYKVLGNLTIKDTTKEVKFYANVKEIGGHQNMTGKITIDRSEYNIRYGSGSFFDGLGDKTIYDEFDIQVSLVSK